MSPRVGRSGVVSARCTLPFEGLDVLLLLWFLVRALVGFRLLLVLWASIFAVGPWGCGSVCGVFVLFSN